MLREIIKPQSEIYNLHIPKEYINQEVEILVLPFSYPNKEQKENSNLENIIETQEIKSFSNHSANLVDEWKDTTEDKIWI